ncbi:hypothetical protein NMG60_11016415 [Bertholletia excelsa]
MLPLYNNISTPLLRGEHNGVEVKGTGRMIWHASDKSATLSLNEEQVKKILLSYAKDGRLSRKELKLALKDYALHFSSWRAWQAIHHADANGDGFISDEEIDELVKYISLKWGLTINKDLFWFDDMEEAICVLDTNVYGT